MMSLTYVMPAKAGNLVSVPVELSLGARQRLRWMDYYERGHTASQTSRYFGISRKTFYQWRKRYDRWHLVSLEERSRRPRRTRAWEVNRIEESRVVALRKEHLRYGKKKLQVLYRQIYRQEISLWKIHRVIQRHRLYADPVKVVRSRQRRLESQGRRRITELQREAREGFLTALDGLTLYGPGLKRYIFTGIDVHSKIALARMYATKGSRNGEDFLQRLYYLLEGRIENVHTDNGSEFKKDFEEGCRSLKIPHYYSRPHTPQDNPFNERFNRTLREEFLEMGHLHYDCEVFNRDLTEWLIEYNFHRPHQALGYQTPIAFHYQHHKVLPMYPSSTGACLL